MDLLKVLRIARVQFEQEVKVPVQIIAVSDLRDSSDHFNKIIIERRVVQANFHDRLHSEAQGSLVSMGVYGEESRKLRELQGKQNELADRLSDVYTEYGQRLAEGIPYWMDNQAPEDLKKCCNQIIRQTSRIAQQNLNLEHLMMEKDIEIHNLKLSQLSEQMNHLNSQIQAIENQKAELQQRVDTELKAISDLKMKQSEITYKVTQYE